MTTIVEDLDARAVLALLAREQKLSGRLADLLRMMVTSLAALAMDEPQLQRQMELASKALGKPISTQMLDEVESCLRFAISQQLYVGHELKRARESLRQAASAFIDQLGGVEKDAGEYSEKVAGYSARINQALTLGEMGELVRALLSDTTSLLSSMEASRKTIHEHQAVATLAEARIQAMETELSKAMEMVHQDFLTGVLNRRGMQSAFSREIARADRHGTPVCAAMLDIDHFKLFNDLYGHAAGDEALAHVARIVQEVLRATDIVARYGGEEFAVMLPDAGIEQGEIAMARAQSALAEQGFVCGDAVIPITFSAGLTQYRPKESLSDVLARADAGLYKAKDAGRNRVFVQPGVGHV